MRFVHEMLDLLDRRLVQFFALAAGLMLVAKKCVDLKYSVCDNDVWWHLKVGDWIVDNLAVPHTGLFSATVADKPWIAYSWGYEVILSLAYRWFHLVGVALLGTILTVAIAYAVFWSLRHLSGSFWMALILAAVALYTFLFILMPRPVFLSMVFYILLLTLLLDANRSGEMQPLYWLPPIFLLWANIHIQFVYGLFVLGLFVAAQLLPSLLERLGIATSLLKPATLPVQPLIGVLCACALATLIGPYGYKLYSVILSYSKAKTSYDIIIELQPFNFRFLFHYLMLLMACTAFAAVGWSKRVDAFKLLVLLFATAVGIRTIRDCWFLAFTAAAILADAYWSKAASSKAPVRRQKVWPELAAIVGVMALFLVILSHNGEFNEPPFEQTVASLFPVGAANFVRQNQLPGPIYNNLDWGGFLIWYLPQYPVAIDGRNDIYGDELDSQFFANQNGEDYRSSVYLNRAGCILMEKKYALSTVLRMDSHYKVVYEDPIAIVFVRA